MFRPSFLLVHYALVLYVGEANQENTQQSVHIFSRDEKLDTLLKWHLVFE